MKTPKLALHDAAAVVLGAGLVLGLAARLAEVARPLAGIFGY